MDPLSVTSGVVGIIAFAFQLAKAASKVKRAVEEIKSAPKEAKELIERLVILETTCQLIGFHLERRETLPGHSLSASPDIISKALAQCLVRIQDLEKMVSSSSLSESLAGTTRSKFDTASRLRLVLRKDRIGSLVQEIDRVISLLQFVIQADMWAITATPLQMLASRASNHGGSQPMDKPLQPEKSSNTALLNCVSQQPIVSLSLRRETNQQRHTSRYLGCITWTTTDGRIGDDDDGNSIAYRKASIAFRLPFTSSQLSVHYVGGMGTPSYALNVTHIIEHNSDLSNRLWDLISPGSDPKELHELIYGRELSIYSVIRGSGSREMTLFFFAVGMRWAEGCKYLLQHDFRHQFEQEETPEIIGSRVLNKFGQTCEITEMILSMRPDDMQEKDIKYLLKTGHHPEYFNRYLKVFLNSPWIDHTDLVSHAWDCIMEKTFPREGYYELSSWIPPLRYLIEQGVDLHQPFNRSYNSAYTRILSLADHPFEADENAYAWLGMLKACGIDLSSYLKVETTLLKTAGISGYATAMKRKLEFLDFEGLPMPSWRREVAMDNNVVELLEEFRNLGNDGLEWALVVPDPSGPDDLKCWKAENIDTEWGEEWGEYCFPFSLSPIDCIIEGLENIMLKETWSRETYNLALEIRNKRLARRQAEKWRKAHPWDKPPSTKMPGTWVD